MSTRPDILFPLFAPLHVLDGIGPKLAKILENKGVHTPRDLLFTLPYAGIDRDLITDIGAAILPAVVTVRVQIMAHHAPSHRSRPYRVVVNDGVQDFTLVFFHAHQTYIEKQLPIGEERIVSGKIEAFDNMAQMVHPEHIIAIDALDDLPKFEPVYPLTEGVSKKVMARAMASALTRIPDLVEWADPTFVAQEKWPDWATALNEAHSPKSREDLTPEAPARWRLAYDEFFAHQLTLALARVHLKKKKGLRNISDKSLQNRLLEALPYVPTGAQTRAVAEIVEDLSAPQRMNRLLQGDVGAGKTLVAMLTLLAAVEAGGQGVLMAPTEILAQQHFESFKTLASATGVHVEILTGRDGKSAKREKLARLKSGDIQILLGTHAVFQDGVEYNDLRLAIIDEQHRFGVQQRLQLTQKGRAVDVLVMTATPIPRSLTLAQYGDMDVSILDEKPAGRKPVKTALVSMDRLDDVAARLKANIDDGTQAFWICPLVEESEVSDLSAATERYKYLSGLIGAHNVGLVHGQMPPEEKDAAMQQFVAGKTKVLVATTVVEVGVDVPNATIMVIERADHFGLSQLHQLRGRVGRGDQEATCLLLFSSGIGETGRKRLTIMRDSDDGFEIANEDLRLRGAGDVIGTAQSGLPRFQIADLEHQAALMAVAQTDARNLLEQDPNLATPRGDAVRVLLWLMKKDENLRLLSVG